MGWWQKMILPLQRLCSGVASRFRCRKAGLLVLDREVKACEYEDVHIMWEMLNKSEPDHHHQQGPRTGPARAITCFVGLDSHPVYMFR